MPAEREVERKDKGKKGKMQNAKEEDNDKTGRKSGKDRSRKTEFTKKN